MEFTLSILKPDAVRKNIAGAINAEIEKAGFRIVCLKSLHLSLPQIQAFYAVHKDRPFFGDLCQFMVSGPVVVQVLAKENAVDDYRTLMGATNPREAASGTLRQMFADSIDENAVHGSDCLENAEKEIRFFFAECELL